MQYTRLLLAELGLKPGQVRELQNVPMARLLAANAAVLDEDDGARARLDGKLTDGRRQGDSRAIRGIPPAPALSADIPLLIGYARTEETLYDRPTPEKLALDEAGLRSARRGAPRRRSRAA